MSYLLWFGVAGTAQSGSILEGAPELEPTCLAYIVDALEQALLSQSNSLSDCTLALFFCTFITCIHEDGLKALSQLVCSQRWACTPAGNPDDWEKLVLTNLVAPMKLTGLLAHKLVMNKGYIINISSVAGQSLIQASEKSLAWKEALTYPVQLLTHNDAAPEHELQPATAGLSCRQ